MPIIWAFPMCGSLTNTDDGDSAEGADIATGERRGEEHSSQGSSRTADCLSWMPDTVYAQQSVQIEDKAQA
jgi:histidyl-tRNA synthetase